MKNRILLAGLVMSVRLLLAMGWLVRPSIAGAQMPAPDTGAGASTRPAGILVVPTLEEPAGPRKLEEQDMAGYLMVYFKDQTQSAYFAISRDGYTFIDVNEGQPVLDGRLLAEQKGVRDPHIARGPD